MPAPSRFRVLVQRFVSGLGRGVDALYQFTGDPLRGLFDGFIRDVWFDGEFNGFGVGVQLDRRACLHSSVVRWVRLVQGRRETCEILDRDI